MRLIKTLAAGALLSSMSLACVAAATTLTFEELDADGNPLADSELVGNFYKLKGITFGDNAYSFLAPGFGGTNARFVNGSMPTPSTAVGLVSESTSEEPLSHKFVVDFENGFESSLSFRYSNVWLTTSSAFRIYSGLGGSGDLLNVVSGELGGMDQSNCEEKLPNGQDGICNWGVASANFSGVAKSVVFLSDAPSDLFIDNLTFGAADPGNNVPEPASLALALAAAGAAALTRRRKVAATAA